MQPWKCAARDLILYLVVFSPHVASGQHVSLPPVNLGDTNFLDGVAGPGLLLEETFECYYGYRFTGPGGQKLSGDNSMESLHPNAAASNTNETSTRSTVSPDSAASPDSSNVKQSEDQYARYIRACVCGSDVTGGELFYRLPAPGIACTSG